MTVLAPVDPEKLDLLRSRLATAQKDSFVDEPEYACPFSQIKTVHFARWAILNPQNGSGDPDDTETYLLFATVYDGKRDDHIKSIFCCDGEDVSKTDKITAADLVFECCKGFPVGADVGKKSGFLKANSKRTNAFYIGAVGRTVEQILAEDVVRQHLNELTQDRERGAYLDQPQKLHEMAREYLQLKYCDDWKTIEASEAPGGHWGNKLAAFLYNIVSNRPRLSLAVVVLLILGTCYWYFGRLVTLIAFFVALIILYSVLRFIRRVERNDDKIRARWQKHEDERNKERREINKEKRQERKEAGKALADGSEVRMHEAAVVRDSEDLGSQNPLTSMIAIKPGLFRWLFLASVLFLTNLLARTVFVRGSLAGLESIHFGRWAIVGKPKYLLFLSDYDGSWESYLGDFISEAAEGVTSIWTNTVFFPRTRYLISGGVTDEHAFKAYGRYMMSETHYFYSAYRGLSLKNILQNSEICAGLKKDDLSPEELKEWAHLVARRAS